jgi:hypothetical protein
MTDAGQMYGNASTAAGFTQANAFSHAPSSPGVALTSNAFGPMGQTLSAAPSSQPPLMLSGTGMATQGGRPISPNSSANPNVAPASFQEAGGANPIVSASYQTTTYQTAQPSPTLTALRPTPENVRQMEIALRDSLYPSQREWAAQNMAIVDWHTQPMIVQFLTTAAKEDPAPTVRATCVRCLANMHVGTVPVITVVRGLKNDADPRVRQEAERALSVLAPGEK